MAAVFVKAKSSTICSHKGIFLLVWSQDSGGTALHSSEGSPVRPARILMFLSLPKVSPRLRIPWPFPGAPYSRTVVYQEHLAWGQELQSPQHKPCVTQTSLSLSERKPFCVAETWCAPRDCTDKTGFQFSSAGIASQERKSRRISHYEQEWQRKGLREPPGLENLAFLSHLKPLLQLPHVFPIFVLYTL